MLTRLTIANFAIIEHTAIDFRPGLNILTGETGAGKSILIDAVGLILGGRADAGAIRHGAEKADISATFSALPHTLAAALREDELDNPDRPGEADIRRVLREGGSKSFINSIAVPGNRLKPLAARLIGIHGQNENHILLKSDEQRNRLDRYAGAGELRARLAAAWQDRLQAHKARQHAQSEQQAQAEKRELLRYQLDELDDIAPQEGEFARLSQEQESLTAAHELLTTGDRLLQLIKEAEPSLQSGLKHAQHLGAQLARTHESFAPLAELLEQSAIYLDEAADTLSRQLARTEHDPDTLARVEERMSALHALARKHQCPPEDLAAHHAALRAQFEAIEKSSENLHTLEQAVQQAETHYRELAAQMHAVRMQHGPKLAEDVQAWIRRLGMAQAEFTVELTPSAQAGAHGTDDITFMLCANPGQTLQPLAKVASGGELSRVSLAIEVACLDENPVPTVIFDEIDTGIGGEIADTIGHLLKTLSQSRQVLCITHLPQVAAYADHHYHIEKVSSQSSTQTRVVPLDEEARIVELARMLGSSKSATSREHAKNLRAQAQQKSI